MEKLVLIDGNSLINRAFYAMPILSTKDGVYTNAIYGFINMFFKMLSDEKPTFIAVAFDLKAPTFRHKMYSEYKGTRKPMPEELRPQIPLLKEVLSLMGIKTIEQEGIEADDIIGTIAKATDVKTIIITGDKDSFQLVDDQTEVHFTKRGLTDVEIYNLDNFYEKTSLNPSQIIDLKALMGDTSDNIPGVSGIGEKTAKTLLETYKTVDNLYLHTDELKGKLQEKIISGKESAFLSKTLATINTECDIDVNLDSMRFSTPFSHQVKQKFIELEFKSLTKKDDLFLDNSITQSQETETQNQDSALKKANITVIDDLSAFTLPQVKQFSFSIAKDSLNLSDGQTEYIFKIRQTLLDDGHELSSVLKCIKNLFGDQHALIVYNKKDLKHFLKDSANIDLTCYCDDLALIKYLADFSGSDIALKEVLEEYNLESSTPAHSMFYLYSILISRLESEGLEKLYKDVELPLTDVLFDMERSGFKIDLTALTELGEKYKGKIADLEIKIRELAFDPTLNVNSPKQLGEVLFEKLKIAKGKKTKTGYSTTAEILESLEDAHPIIPVILEYRHLQKLSSTYIEGFKPLVDKKTGLIHTTFNQTLTATGRLSSKEPNLQNVPVRDENSREIRRFFAPKTSDRILISADYSQIELRLLASFSKCQSLIDAFNQEKDIHTATASKVFKKPINDVTSDLRSKAKAVNFGIIYGISEYGLAKQLKIPNGQAREFIQAYFTEYPEVKKYMDDNVAFARENGYAKTLLGRKRYIREINASNYNMRQFGERVAMNMPLQGSSADIIKIAMINVAKRLKEQNLKSELILQVHDELIIDAEKSEKDKVIEILTQEMQGAVVLDVPLTVSVGSGATWYEAK
ncbi:MAG: DNA polymerase I [Clostridiales bacterium]|nr:DNA polymerase I [Clostridiales bacterium]